MKKSILIVVTFLISSLGFAQENAIDNYFKHYTDQDAFTKVTISGKMFELFAYFDSDDEETKEVLETIRNLSGMKMLICDSLANGVPGYRAALKQTPNEYEVLMSVDDEDDDLTFLIKERDGVIHELLLIGGNEKSLFIMSLYGVIDLKQISKLAKHVNIDGLEHLEHVGE